MEGDLIKNLKLCSILIGKEVFYEKIMILIKMVYLKRV